jgi:hypothetical protein
VEGGFRGALARAGAAAWPAAQLLRPRPACAEARVKPANSCRTSRVRGALGARPNANPSPLTPPLPLPQVLIVSDEHPNVVRCFAMEEDREFVYLALERCRCTLSDWVASKEGQARGGARGAR